jgi:hypothetical protein
MACYKATTLPSGVTTTGRTSYATEAECNQACKEGACCEGTTCTVKPACQCQGAGKAFKGVGTVCTPNPCGCCGNGESIAGKTATIDVSSDSMPTARWCPQVVGGTTFLQCPDGIQYGGCVSVKPCETPAVGAWIDTAGSASTTFTGNSAASACSLSLQGQCPGFGSRSASVFLQPSPCKIYATVDCSSLIAAVDSYRGRFSVNPYWAWDYGSQTSEYNTRYYVFQYLSGTGISTVTQSINSTPVPPDIAGYFWYLSKTVTVNMRLTLV